MSYEENVQKNWNCFGDTGNYKDRNGRFFHITIHNYSYDLFQCLRMSECHVWVAIICFAPNAWHFKFISYGKILLIISYRCHLLRQMSSQWGSQRLLQRLVSHELTAYLSVFNLFLTHWIMAVLFLVTPCLVVAVQPCIEWIPIKKKKKWS